MNEALDLHADLTASFDRYGVPSHLRDGLAAWIRTGRPTGHFLRAVLENDLRETIARGDEISLIALPAIVRWLHNEAPSGAHGNPTTVNSWREQGGLQGLVSVLADSLKRMTE